MNNPTILPDQPAGLAQDRLHFRRHLQALETRVLLPLRQSPAPFWVGIYGPPGSGKSSLLRMLAEYLRQPEQATAWRVVHFNAARHAPDRLWPAFLACLGESQAAFGQLIDTPSGELPAAIRRTLELEAEGHWAILLEDLEYCRDACLAAHFLQQVKDYFNYPRCLLWLGGDRSRLIAMLETAYPGSGELRLQTLVQLPFELPPPPNPRLIAMLGFQAPESQGYFLRVAELFQHNPRQIKLLWNQALMGLSVIKTELEQVQGFCHEPNLELMIKWLLLRHRGGLRHNPYRYLGLEVRAGNPDDQREFRQNFLELLGFAPDALNNFNDPPFERRLAVFLWHDLTRRRFGNPRILSLYAGGSGEDASRSRLFIEECRFAGIQLMERQDFAWAALGGGYFGGVRFVECDFSYADLQGAELDQASFERCQLKGARFDRASLANSRWIGCDNLDYLDTQPDTYEQIADLAVDSWLAQPLTDWDPEALYKVYKTILNRHGDTATEGLRQRLLRKGMRIREKVIKSW